MSDGYVELKDPGRECATCNQKFYYEDELVFLDGDGCELFHQDAMDSGFSKVVCTSCHMEAEMNGISKDNEKIINGPRYYRGR